DLGRVDVDAAGDDHVALPVAQEQVAVRVQVADVAHGEHAAGARGAGLRLVLVVLEGRGAHAHVDQAGLAGGHVVACLVEHVDLGAGPGQADRTGPGQPLRPGDDGATA